MVKSAHVDVEVNEEWILNAEKDDHNLYASLRNTESEPHTDIDSTEVAVDANANSEFTNDISNCGPTLLALKKLIALTLWIMLIVTKIAQMS